MEKLDPKCIQNILALTPMQEGMLFHYLKSPESHLYFEQLSLEIFGKIDISRFEHAWNRVVRDNEILRTVFRWEKIEKPSQIFLKEYFVKPIYHDLSSMEPGQKKIRLQELKDKDRDNKFDLHDVPFRITLCKLDANCSELIISNHHILYDGWSTGIILKEFFKSYHETTETEILPELAKTPFKEYIKWIQLQDTQEHDRYWREYLRGLDSCTRLPVKNKKIDNIARIPGYIRSTWPAEFKKKLECFVKNYKITLASLLYGAWGLLLNGYNNSDDAVFGATTSGRSAKIKGIEEMVGVFINTLPLRVQTFEYETIKDFLLRLDNAMQSWEAHEIVSLVHIRTLCDGLSDQNEEFFDTIIALENYPFKLESQTNALITPGAHQMIEMTHYDLTIGITFFDDIEISFIYNQSLLEKETVSRLARHFENIIETLIGDPLREAAGIEMISEEEKKQLLFDFNRTEVEGFPANKTIHELFEKQVQRIPDFIAVFSHGQNQATRTNEEEKKKRREEEKNVGADLRVCPISVETLRATSLQQTQQITYRQLNEQSDRLARLLIEKGSGVDIIIGIMMERSVDMVIGIMGILKSGGAYLPIDPAYPEERVNYMLKDSGAKLLITTSDKEGEKVGRWEGEKVIFEDFFKFPYLLTFLPSYSLNSLNLAYIIYTSGSTGSPKGVMVEHGSVLNILTALQREYPLLESDTYLLKTSFIFDVSVAELFGWFLGGGRLAVLVEGGEKDPDLISLVIEKAGITHINFVPSMFRVFIDILNAQNAARLVSLKYIFLAGEALPPETVHAFRRWNKTIALENIYGPTESTIYASRYSLSQWPGTGIIPIGKPMSGLQLYVLNKRCLQPIGAPGELYIAGAGLARGYLNKPELTANRFNKSYGSYKTYIFYKTGDLVRWLPDGNIEFLGRIDQQIKIRGFRIELGEIENALRSHPHIKEAAVYLEKDANDNPNLCAYIAYAVDGVSESIFTLREYLSRRLPNYMVPSHFNELKNIPLTPSGKIDRRALKSNSLTLNSGVEYIAPQSNMEKIIAQIWREMLGIDNVGIHDNFFDRGGNSLLIIRLSSRLSQALQMDIPVVTLFNHPTIASLVNHLFQPEKKETVNHTKNLKKTINETGEIAVIGMAGRFPGAKNIEQFWENLKNGIESITFFSKEELKEMDVNPEWLDNPEYLYVPAKGVLAGNNYFDDFFFGYTPMEASIMDPQVRIFHECVWEALENAAYNPGNYPGPIGLFAGASPNPFWEVMPLRSMGNVGGKDYPGLWNAIQFSDKDYLSTRIAYKLDLKGPCVTLQTACSTSLVAVDQACRSLLDMACDIALAGGISVTLHDEAGYLYQEGTIMSPDGHCRTFDAKAQGTVGGNGVGVVVLKRLEEAIDNGDQVLAVIKGLGITNDGKNKVGFTAPSSEGQAAAIRAAINMAGVNPESIGYIETHGTGTPLGDPIEIEGLKKVFSNESNTAKQQKYCALGSVKTNIGHLDAAAGIAGFIKTVLILHYRMIPPSLFFERPNPALDLENTPFYVNTELLPWNNSKYPLRAGVSSFGLGGTNVHMILEEYKEGAFLKNRPLDPQKTFYYLITLSALTLNALEQITSNLALHFEQNPNINLSDASYTLQVGRKAFKHRRFLICTDLMDAVRLMSTGETENGLAMPEKPTIIFMFSGQGSQYVNMGLDLYQHEPFFHDLVDHCFNILEKITGLDMKPVLYPPKDQVELAEERIYQFLYTTPIKFIFEYALARLLISWGIKPDAMIGHSFGEYVAACLAGVFSLEDGLYLAALRGEVMHSLPEGAMLSVPLSEKELTPLLNDRLSLATIDAPSQSVVSGPVDAIEKFAQQLNNMGHECIRFRVPKAGHSWMVESIQPDFKKKIAGKTFSKPTIPYISGMSGQWISAEEVTKPDYWVRHLRATVRFADGLTTLFKEPNPVFLQVGPGKGLTMFVNRHPSMKPGIPTFNMLRHPKEETTDVCYLLTQVGRLWMLGVEIDLPAFHTDEKRKRISLPNYPFERNIYPVDKNLFKLNATAPAAATLKKNPNITDWFYIPSWQRVILSKRKFKTNEEKNIKTNGNGPALILMDQSGLGWHLKKELEAQGEEVFVSEIHAGTYDDFISALAFQNKYPYLVYHLTGVDPIGNSGDYKEKTDDILARTFYSLLDLVQALVKHQTNPQRETHLKIVTSGAQEVTGEEELCPAKATIYGLCRVISQEFPTIHCHCHDILVPVKNMDWQKEGLNLLADLVNCAQADTGQTIAYRGHYRWLQSYKPQRLEKSEPSALPLRPGGVYLITGGLGAIGLILARHLARTYKAKLVLTGRSKFPDAANWPHWLVTHPEEDPVSRKIRKLMEIETLGGQVSIFSADVTDRESMQKVLHCVANTFGFLNGIIHAAGIVGRDSFIALADMKKADAQLQFEPKIYGLQVLAEILKDNRPDFCMVMSSTSAVLGGLGFGAYAAANAFMDAYIHKQNQSPDNHGTGNTRWFSINWDGWQLEEQNFQDTPLGAVIKDLAMTPEEGTEVMERVLANADIQQVVQCTGDLQLRIDRWKIPNAEQLPNVNALGQAACQTRPARPHLDTPYQAPANPMEEAVAKIWLDLLGYDRIGIQDNFFALNGDSLKAVIAVSTIHKQLGIKVPLTEFFAMPTIADLARYISAGQKPTPVPAVTITTQLQPMPEQRYMAIPAVEKREYYPLSSAQKRMYILNRMDQTSTAYNITSVMELRGELDEKKFQDTFNGIIQRHESLRTSFLVINEEPVQRIHENIATDEIRQHGQTRTLIEVFGPTFFQKGGPPEALMKSFVRPFDLAYAPLIRVGLIKEEEKHILIVDMHHIISDGTSMGILANDFMKLFQGEKLTPLGIQYKDYAFMQYFGRNAERWNQQGNYWHKELAGVLPILNLPTDVPRPSTWDFAGRQCRFKLESADTAALKMLARAEDVTLYTVLLSIYTIMLAKLAGQEELLLGAPMAGRSHADVQQVIGMFINTLVLRCFPVMEKSYRYYLLELKAIVLAGLENQDYPFEDVVEQMALSRELGRNPLFDVAFVLQNMAVPEIEIPGLKLTPGTFDSGAAKLDIALIAEELYDTLYFTFEYRTSLFKAETIERFGGYFKQIVSVITAGNRQRLCDIDMISQEEKSRIIEEFNHTEILVPSNKTLQQLFREQAEYTPDNIAVVGATIGEEKKRRREEEKTVGADLRVCPISLTYRRLDEQAGHLANLLIEKGVMPNNIVGIMMGRSIDLIIGILGILKAGGAYLPIDPDYPQERIHYILNDSNAKLLITSNGKESEEVKMWEGELLAVANGSEGERLRSWEVKKNSSSFLTSYLPNFLTSHPFSLAYIIYTSGSTGRPKGVMVEHRSLVNLCTWHNWVFGVTEKDRSSQYTSFTFDASVWEIFPYLVKGAALYIINSELKLNIPALNDYFEIHGITIAFLPTQVCEQFMQFTNVSLRILLTGGDKLHTFTPRSYVLYNNYGPTENTVVSSFYRVENWSYNIPIGRPTANNCIYILPKDGMALQPVGVPGELCIGGYGLARGYLNKPELTLERFYRSNKSNKTYILYKTGDLARWLPDGNIEFIGRIDRQVKIRGFRIELSEIESCLTTLDNIKEAVVIDRKDNKDENYICAYIVCRQEPDTDAIIKSLSRVLPRFMIPAYFIPLSSIPLTPNGKIDRGALPAPEFKTKSNYKAPDTSLQHALAEIWAEVLALPKDKISIYDDFFKLGGHSLKAAVMVERIHKNLQVTVPLNKIFETPTIADLASLINLIQLKENLTRSKVANIDSIREEIIL